VMFIGDKRQHEQPKAR